MNFHIFSCIPHLLRVYYELTKWPAPNWHESSVGRTLHRYRRGHGFAPLSGLTFLEASIPQLFAHNCDDKSYLPFIRRSSKISTFIYSLVFYAFYGCITNSQSGQLPVGLIAQLVKHCTGIAGVMGSNRV